MLADEPAGWFPSAELRDDNNIGVHKVGIQGTVPKLKQMRFFWPFFCKKTIQMLWYNLIKTIKVFLAGNARLIQITEIYKNVAIQELAQIKTEYFFLSQTFFKHQKVKFF